MVGRRPAWVRRTPRGLPALQSAEKGEVQVTHLPQGMAAIGLFAVDVVLRTVHFAAEMLI
jgi:hypothetical protein